MNVIVWLVTGGAVGWLVSRVLKIDEREVMLLNVMVAIAGAELAGWVVSPLIGAGTIYQAHFSVASMLVSLVGAVTVLAVVSPFRPTAVR